MIECSPKLNYWAKADWINKSNLTKDWLNAHQDSKGWSNAHQDQTDLVKADQLN